MAAEATDSRSLFLPTKLSEKVREWRESGYPCSYPAISEILEYCVLDSETGERSFRYLRKAQFEALETYWYLRLAEGTPKVLELYKRLYDDPAAFFGALGIQLGVDDVIRLMSAGGIGAVLEKIRSDDDFVKRNKLEPVRESLALDYPSYIFALAMGAGKTVLIGSIIATEFAMGLEYRSGFVKNALVFAPGKTILGALRELSDVPYENILPPRFYNAFLSSVKVTYTQDNEKGIPIVEGSSYNIVVTNTEKIRIQKPTGKPMQPTLLNLKELEQQEEAEEVANLRLQIIASLPDLAIFSDEAHHTYGQSLDVELKKVRKTVDYLAENQNVVVVVNTTGTPYFKNQMLRDVVFWYGLSQGIRDGILKEVKDSVFSYEDVGVEEFTTVVLEDFFKAYKDVKIGEGVPSKIAIYFPQTDDLKRITPLVQRRVRRLGLDPSTVLAVHNKSDDKTKDFFNNKINEPSNPFRIYLLVNMGTEGWNCPSLFATALARKLRSSNNFVLQAASRCLRQVPGNVAKARIYLSKENVGVLDTQLRETFGETLQILDKTPQDLKRARIVVRKTEMPPILLRRKIRRVTRIPRSSGSLALTVPAVRPSEARKVVYDVQETEGQRGTLRERGVEAVEVTNGFADTYLLAVDFATTYRIDTGTVLSLLEDLYPTGYVPLSHVEGLQKQIEDQSREYKVTEEHVDVALALVKKDGFNKEMIDGKPAFTAEIVYHRDKADLLLAYEKSKSSRKDLSFHYSPYHMDSHPERDFFLTLLDALDEDPDDVLDVCFTGAITDPKKTDFYFEYKDTAGKWRTYTPDFIVRKKDGKILIVEVKSPHYRDETKEMALRKIEGLNPDTIRYEVLLTNTDEIGLANRKRVEQWLYKKAD